jgi:DNA repair exonuclease SbcCD ATPase subunit
MRAWQRRLDFAGPPGNECRIIREKVLRVNDAIETNATVQKSSRSNWIHFLFSGVVLLFSVVFYQSSQAEALRHEVAQLRRDNSVLRENVAQSDRALQDAVADFHRELADFHNELAIASAETGEAQADVVRHADELVDQLERKHRQQETRQRQLSAELNSVKQSTAETSTRLNGISSAVGSVKSEVESVRSVAREASSVLQQTRGDMGMIGGLIATNSSEIQTLRDLGDRNVYEFTLAKSDGMRRVANIEVKLDRTDVKGHRFTLRIQAADQLVEKRDRTVNEPVQFYVPGKGRSLYELVINEVGRDTVKGYLATPKATLARNGSSDGN